MRKRFTLLPLAALLAALAPGAAGNRRTVTRKVVLRG